MKLDFPEITSSAARRVILDCFEVNDHLPSSTKDDRSPILSDVLYKSACFI